MTAKVKYVPTQVKVYDKDNRLMGYIGDEHFKDPTWILFSREMDTLYTGTSLEDCQDNIQLLIDWWEEEKDDY